MTKQPFSRANCLAPATRPGRSPPPCFSMAQLTCKLSFTSLCQSKIYLGTPSRWITCALSFLSFTRVSNHSLSASPKKRRDASTSASSAGNKAIAAFLAESLDISVAGNFGLSAAHGHRGNVAGVQLRGVQRTRPGVRCHGHLGLRGHHGMRGLVKVRLT